MLVVGDHAAPVLSLAFAPNSVRIVSGGKDGTARVWSLGGGPPTVLSGHTEPVTAVACSPDGGWIATGSGDRAARLWPAAGGAAETLRGPHDAAVTAVTFFHGGRLLATATGNRIDAGVPGEVRIWRVENRRQVRVRGEPNGVWTLAATPADKMLAWAGGDKRATVWDITAQDHILLPTQRIGVLAIALSADGRTLAATDDWAIRVYDTKSRQELATLNGHKGRVCALAFAPDGATLLSAGWDGRVTMWDVSAGRESHTYAWPIGRPRAVTFSPDGLLAAAAGDAGTVVVWDVE
jgi:WD40 repeat protein